MRLNMRNLIKKLTALAMFVCLVPFLKLLLPAPLQSADTIHLARLAIEWQRFPVDTEAIGGDNTSIPIHVDVQSVSKHLLKTWHTPNKKIFENNSMIKQFMPTMSLEERTDLLVTFETFVRACDWANLTYFLFSGSMLGAYRHHGFIPWDDDVDLVMDSSDWRKIRNVLSRVPGFELYAPSKVQWKFYRKDLPLVPGKPFKWPHIDIFFFKEDSTHVWALTGGIKTELVIPKEDIFPLQTRPFENRHVAVPCKMDEMILKQYGIHNCLSLAYSHKDSVPVDSSDVQTVPCEQLYHIFPFVFRHKDPISGNILETLKRGDKVLRNISIQQRCR
ncbi:uncharacterized protein LOC121384036 [Gigantopelta aegis]|uniref:uncharacterized protein LOC121384036 n=1 Tax=Gigantopelta aegis TaxID=1735272 RepID=UPI001B888D9E|nr:uncharacterized protein LOC121384036 [Gigantopelta aegis]XP_041370141.1 uncharacterized protein LOC121384036 [Gigantopelta aegis]